MLISVSALVKYALASHYEFILVRGEAKRYHLSFSEYYLIAALTSLFFVCLSAAVKFGVDWFNNQERQKNLEN